MRGGPGRRRWPGEPHGYVKSRKDESQPALRFPDPTVPAEMGEHRENAAVRAAGGFLRRGWGLSAGLGCCSRTACRHSPPSPVPRPCCRALETPGLPSGQGRAPGCDAYEGGREALRGKTSPEITAPGAATQVPARIQAGVRHAASTGRGAPGCALSTRTCPGNCTEWSTAS